MKKRTREYKANFRNMVHFWQERCKAKDNEINELIMANNQLMKAWEGLLAEIILKYGNKKQNVIIGKYEVGKYHVIAEPLDDDKIKFSIEELDQA